MLSFFSVQKPMRIRIWVRFPMRMRAGTRECGRREYECHLLLLMQCKTLRLLNLKSKQKSYGMNFYDMQISANPRLLPLDRTSSAANANATAPKNIYSRKYCIYSRAGEHKSQQCRRTTTIKCWLDGKRRTGNGNRTGHAPNVTLQCSIFHLPAAHHQFAMTVLRPQHLSAGRDVSRLLLSREGK